MNLMPAAQPYFNRLGTQISELWQQQHYDENAFPAIAETVLRNDPPSDNVSLWDSLKFAFLSEDLPVQVDLEATFGQPPLTVYWQPDFRIELLYWVLGLPGIHQHAFSGAFHVMHGSSLHTEWVFQQHHRVTTRLLVGKLGAKRAELLEKGDTRPIFAGSDFIHATYHLDRPTISVVVRTNREEDHLPQYLYLPPSIAIPPHPGPRVQRRNQLMKMLSQSGHHKELLEIVLHFLETADAFSALHCVLESYPLLRNGHDRCRIMFAASRRHPALTTELVPVLAAAERRSQICELREKTSNRDLQFFLALLLNIPDGKTILGLIRARHKNGDPVDRIVCWMAEMYRLRLLEIQLPDRWSDVLRELLPDGNGPMRYSGFGSDSQALEIATKLRSYWLLEPLFASAVPATMIV